MMNEWIFRIPKMIFNRSNFVFSTPKIIFSLGPIFVSPELSSVRDYVITHSVRSMYVVHVVYVCMW